MVDFYTDVSMGLRKEVNMFFLACHCVAHRTNRVVLDAAKTLNCKVLSTETNVLINFKFFS